MLDLADLDHTLIYFVSFLAAFLSIRPTLRAVGTCGALLLAWTFVKLELTFDLADLLLNEGTNPQFITAGVAALGIFGLAIRVSRTRWRTMDRTLIYRGRIKVNMTQLKAALPRELLASVVVFLVGCRATRSPMGMFGCVLVHSGHFAMFTYVQPVDHCTAAPPAVL